MKISKFFAERDIRSYGKRIEAREKNIAKLEEKIAFLKARCDAGKMTKAAYEKKKDGYMNSIHGMKDKIKVLRGAIARETRGLKEKEQKEREESEKKEKEGKPKR